MKQSTMEMSYANGSMKKHWWDDEIKKAVDEETNDYDIKWGKENNTMGSLLISVASSLL